MLNKGSTHIFSDMHGKKELVLKESDRHKTVKLKSSKSSGDDKPMGLNGFHGTHTCPLPLSIPQGSPSYGIGSLRSIKRDLSPTIPHDSWHGFAWSALVRQYILRICPPPHTKYTTEGDGRHHESAFHSRWQQVSFANTGTTVHFVHC